MTHSLSIGTALACAMALGCGSAHALSLKECGVKYQAAKNAGTLSGQSWRDFRKAECGLTPPLPRPPPLLRQPRRRPRRPPEARYSRAASPRNIPTSLLEKGAGSPASISTGPTRPPMATAVCDGSRKAAATGVSATSSSRAERATQGACSTCRQAAGSSDIYLGLPRHVRNRS
jgi:hypothetical protein